MLTPCFFFSDQEKNSCLCQDGYSRIGEIPGCEGPQEVDNNLSKVFFFLVPELERTSERTGQKANDIRVRCVLERQALCPLPSLLRRKVEQRTAIQIRLGDLRGERPCSCLLRGTPVFPHASAIVGQNNSLLPKKCPGEAKSLILPITAESSSCPVRSIRCHSLESKGQLSNDHRVTYDMDDGILVYADSCRW